MTVPSIPATRFSQGDFRIGRVFSRAGSLLGQNFLKFMLIEAIAFLPGLLAPRPTPGVPANPLQNLEPALVSFALLILLGVLVHATVLHAASQGLRGQPVNFIQSFQVALRRFFPVLGVAICAFVVVVVLSIGIILGLSALTILFLAFSPGARAVSGFAGALAILIVVFALYAIWFVATPVCVIERLGPIRSLRRSAELTKGFRWKLIALSLAILIALIIFGVVLAAITFAVVGFGGTAAVALGLSTIPGKFLNIALSALWGAYLGIVILVAYHDLRVVKEGIDTDQIAAVFE